jgi:prepilin-type N-terminal cleavage/methylation domain-containing protein
MDMKRYPSRAFTIIELLVVVSIIALLVGILLPAIGKAREGALLTRSQANMKNLGAAHATYAGEYNDRQLTYVNDMIARYGNGGSGPAMFSGWLTQVGFEHPPIILGYGSGVIAGFWPHPPYPGNWSALVPLDFATRFGAFRIPNGRQFSQYLTGRFYDPVFYAPKDTAVQAALEPLMDDPNEYTQPPAGTPGGAWYWSSYCLSPAGMFNPDVLALNKNTGKAFINPMSMHAGYRSPAFSQAAFPDLKTHMLEHHWLQGKKKQCNPYFGGNGTYAGCEPYYFNAGWESNPVTLFYDGHIEQLGARDVVRMCARQVQQTGYGLWSKDCPSPMAIPGGWATEDGQYIAGGYFQGPGITSDWTSTSYHILTTGGIRGRDKSAD